LTYIFSHADATKSPRKTQILKNSSLADSAESILKTMQLANKHVSKIEAFLSIMVASASVKIDVNKFYKIYQLDALFVKKLPSQNECYFI
jgi:hypothetical protein